MKLEADILYEIKTQAHVFELCSVYFTFILKICQYFLNKTSTLCKKILQENDYIICLKPTLSSMTVIKPQNSNNVTNQ